jgi:hypothetical protein
VTAEQYRTALDAARRELDALVAQRDQLDTRIAQLHQTIATLAPLCYQYPDLDLGMTAACRTVLRGSVEALSAPDVRDRIGALGLDLTRYANALAVVHTTLKRLVETGEARSTTGYGNKTVFWWQRPVHTVVIPAHDAPAVAALTARLRPPNAIGSGEVGPDRPDFAAPSGQLRPGRPRVGPGVKRRGVQRRTK